MINDHSRASLIKLIQNGDDKLKMVQIFNAILLHGPIGRRQISKITVRNLGMLLSICKPLKNTND